MRRLVEARLVDVRHAAREQDVLETIYAHETAQPSKERADTAEDEPQLGVLWLEHGVRLHEVHRALARLEASDEEDVALSVLVLGEWLRARVELDVDTVRDDPVLAGKVRRDEVARRARHRDACVELVHVAIPDHASGPVRKREPAERVERRHLRASGRVEDLHREERHERLVVVDDVESLALEHSRHEPFEAERECDPPDRAVVRHGDRLADLDHVLRRRIIAPGRGDDADVVTETAELLVALTDVRIGAARTRIRVRGNDSDFHGFLPPERVADHRAPLLLGRAVEVLA